MRSIVEAVGPLGLKPGARGKAFTTLLRAIVGQQLSGKAAETIFNRLVATLPDPRSVTPEQILAMEVTDMRAAGLSGAKTNYIRDLALQVAEGTVKLDRLTKQTDEQIIESLTRVKGIGRWTAEMFLMFKLGRPDILPVDDLGIRNGFKRAYGIDPTPAAMIEIAEPWRPFRSAASWYLWRSLDLPTP